LYDGGCGGGNVANAVKKLLEADASVVKRNKLHKFAVFPKRRRLSVHLRGWKTGTRKLSNMLPTTVLSYISLFLNYS
jgi:hypothetical protein